MRTDYSIPMLISGEREDCSEYVLTIIGDKLLFYKPYWNFYLNPFSAYNSLLLLSESSAKVKIIPSELHKYFEKKKPLEENKIWLERKKLCNDDSNSFCLLEVSTGEESNFQSNIVNYIIEISEESILLRFYSTIIKADEENCMNTSKQIMTQSLNLTPKEAFILFANICVAYFESFNFFPKNQDSIQMEGFVSNMGSDLRSIYNFSNKYLQWLGKNLANGEIDPQMVLQYNGCRTLSQLLDKPTVQEIPTIQNLLWESLQVVENYNNTSTLKLILYYSFYRESFKRSYFKLMRRWGKIANKIKTTEFFDIEVDKHIRNKLTQLKDEEMEKIS